MDRIIFHIDVNSDILENDLQSYDAELLPILLIDRSKTACTGEIHNILWGTDNYHSHGPGYGEWDEITIDAITNEHGKTWQDYV